MKVNKLITALENNQKVFISLLENAEEELITWKPGPDAWSLLEIICHLCDEERGDFRARVEHVLFNNEKAMPPGDPAAWYKEGNYLQQNFNEKIAEFRAERNKSVDWLKSLNNPDWQKAYNHHKFGLLTAEFFLVNWVAHDYLHIRQINKNKYKFLQATNPVNLDYAGRW